MENPIINPHNLIDFTLINTHHTSPPLANNGISSGGDDEGDDIEMITLQGTSSYTTLKDLLLDSPPFTGSPTGGSWKEIPIKDPLLQHAAWAYLQPTGEARDEEKPWWRRLEERCCGLFGCFSDVVALVFRRGGGSGDQKFD